MHLKSILKFLILLVSLILIPPISAFNEALSEVRQKQLIHLLKQDCGSCHGLTLKGGLGPALLPDVLLSKPAL